MSLRQYEYALAVAEHGSVTAAAELLRVAQPSMSQQIRGLERELGVKLFDRTPTGLVPTAVGHAFLREAEVAVSASRRARATARAGADELVGELVVAAQMGFGTRQLPGALGALRRRFPRLEVTVFEEPSSAELDRLCRRGVLDLALMAECEGTPTTPTTSATRSSWWCSAPDIGCSPRTGSSCANWPASRGCGSIATARSIVCCEMCCGTTS